MSSTAPQPKAQLTNQKPGSNPSETQVIRVGSSVYTGRAGADEEAWCKDWRLTKAQVEQFFRLSKHYDENPYSLFYQVSCSIPGELQAEGRTWKFAIEGGGTATWDNAGTTRYWGCGSKECEPLVILLTDFMEG